MRRRKRLDRLECLEIADTCTFFSVRRASRVVGKIFDEALRPVGVRATQFSLLVGLGMVESATVTRMADSLALDRTSLTRNLGPLERSGLVESFGGADGRERRVRLTERGARRLADGFAHWQQAQQNVVARLGKTRWKVLMSGLRLAREMSGPSRGRE